MHRIWRPRRGRTSSIGRDKGPERPVRGRRAPVHAHAARGRDRVETAPPAGRYLVEQGKAGRWVRGEFDPRRLVRWASALLGVASIGSTFSGIEYLTELAVMPHDAEHTTLGIAAVAIGLFGIGVTTYIAEPEVRTWLRLLEARRHESHLVRPFSLQPLSVAEARRKATLLQELWPNGIGISHVRQQSIGDCYLLAWLHGLKRLDAAIELSALLVDERDGIYWVNFIGLGLSIGVTPEELARGEVDVLDSSGRWRRRAHVDGARGDLLLELAYDRLRRLHGIRRYSAANPADPTVALDGGYAEEVAAAFLGRALATHAVVENEDEPLGRDAEQMTQARRLLAQAAQRPRQTIVWAATPTALDPAIVDDGLKSCHAYAVHTIDSGTGRVLLTDPHRTEEAVGVSFDTLARHFAEVETTTIHTRALQALISEEAARQLHAAEKTHRLGIPAEDRRWIVLGDDSEPIRVERGQILYLRLGATLLVEVAFVANRFRLRRRFADESWQDVGHLQVTDDGDSTMMLGRSTLPGAPADVRSAMVRVRYDRAHRVRLTLLDGRVAWRLADADDESGD